MSILRKKVKKEDINENKFVGGIVPRQFADYLTLYTLAYGVTKSSILTEVLKYWIVSLSEEVLLESIAKRAYIAWKESDKTFGDFLTDISLEFDKKGLNKYSVVLTKLIKDEKKKSEKGNVE